MMRPDELRAKQKADRAMAAQQSNRIDALVADVLDSPRGLDFLTWLRSITIERVSDENVSPNVLSYREGARALYAEIFNRFNAGMHARHFPEV